MSRIAKKPIQIPKEVSVEEKDRVLTISGKGGSLFLKLRPEIILDIVNDDGGKMIKVDVSNHEDGQHKAFWGLFYRLIVNMIKGITEGYNKQLELVGIGYKAQVSGNKLVLELGFSHPVDVVLPAGVQVKVEKNIITLSGIDKQLVGNLAAEIRNLRKPEPYKGKGIRYVGEVVRKKAGKTAVKTGA